MSAVITVGAKRRILAVSGVSGIAVFRFPGLALVVIVKLKISISEQNFINEFIRLVSPRKFRQPRLDAEKLIKGYSKSAALAAL
jgi:hypothetical protein